MINRPLSFIISVYNLSINPKLSIFRLEASSSKESKLDLNSTLSEQAPMIN